MREYHHVPVLVDAVVELLAPRPGASLVDGTLGGGGHTRAFLLAGADVLGLDRDPAAIAAASALLVGFGDRFRARQVPFSRIAEVAPPRVDGILLDLGVSSHQIDTAARGFSFQHDGPLDGRMDPSGGESVGDLLNRVSEPELADILYRFGEERLSRRVARAIVAARPIGSTLALAAVVAAVVPASGRIHPATRTFQALRIAVNDEMGELATALRTAPALLAPGGRMAVISFHSLEDRAVKQRFRELAGEDAPRDLFGHPLSPPLFRLVERRARTGESDPNPRARSARLRVIERLP